MSDHLPQCFLATACKHDYYDEPPVQCANCGEECICDRLRACEERLMRESIDSGLPTSERQREWWISFRMGKRDGVAAGVQAARDAVAGLPWDNSGAIDPVDAIAAIDALRGGDR